MGELQKQEHCITKCLRLNHKHANNKIPPQLRSLFFLTWDRQDSDMTALKMEENASHFYPDLYTE